jgi:hypothetical protein
MRPSMASLSPDASSPIDVNTRSSIVICVFVSARCA